MSVHAMTAAFSAAAPSPAAKLLMLALANFANENGYCWPSQHRLSRDTGMSERNVRRTMGLLETERLIERQERRRPDGSRQSDMICLRFAQPANPATSEEQPANLAPPPGQHGPTPPDNLSGHEPSIRTTREPRVSPAELADLEEKFVTWWAIYPRKVDKGAARKAFSKVLASGLATFDELVLGARRYRALREGEDPTYTKYPAAWLRAEAWSDEAPSRPARSGTPATRPSAIGWALQGAME